MWDGGKVCCGCGGKQSTLLSIRYIAVLRIKPNKYDSTSKQMRMYHVEHKLTLISIAGTRANEHKLKVVGSQTTKRIAVKGMDRFHVSTGFARLS